MNLRSLSLVTSALLASACAHLPDPVSRERIAEIIASPDRREADRTTDLRRKPAQMLEFIGVRPGMVVLDLSAGGGYTSELLARSVGPTGRVYGQSRPRDPNNPPPKPAARSREPHATSHGSGRHGRRKTCCRRLAAPTNREGMLLL